jgi:hypothetical protein
MLLIWRFITIMLVALTTGLAFAHVLELPARMLYDANLYVTVQKTLYAITWRPPNIGAVLELAAIFMTAVLCAAVRRRKRAFWLSLCATIALLLAPVIYFIYIEPVNEILRTTSAIPANWMQLRLRWETGQAIRFLLQLLALGLLSLSGLFETGKRKFMSDEY